jgi:hypothetical protein
VETAALDAAARLVGPAKERLDRLATRSNVAAELAQCDAQQVIPLTERGNLLPSEQITAAFGDQAKAWVASADKAYHRLSGQPRAEDRRARRHGDLHRRLCRV